MTVHIVLYRYTADPAGRAKVRDAHLEFLQTLAARGTLLCCGRADDQISEGALLVLDCASSEEAERATADDPFRVNGQVAEVSVRSWTPVIGRLAPLFT